MRRILGCGGLPLPRLRVPPPRLGEFAVTLGERGEQSLARRFGRLSRGGGNLRAKDIAFAWEDFGIGSRLFDFPRP